MIGGGDSGDSSISGGGGQQCPPSSEMWTFLRELLASGLGQMVVAGAVTLLCRLMAALQRKWRRVRKGLDDAEVAGKFLLFLPPIK